MYTLEDVYKTFPSGCTEDYKILRAFEMGKQTREKRIAELEKENAELSMKRKAERKIFQGIVEKKNDQLTKAKEIIKIFLKYEICTLNIKDELADNIVKAKAFLKREVEK